MNNPTNLTIMTIPTIPNIVVQTMNRVSDPGVVTTAAGRLPTWLQFASLLLLCTFGPIVSFGQDVPDIVPPSPGAFEMTRFAAQQPNLYTGTANVSVPLYTIPYDGWAIPLSLSYGASGIKANQEASEVGLGWSLNATAVVSRTILGKNDLFQGVGSQVPGYVYDPEPIPDTIVFNDEYWQRLYYSSGAVDTRPDLFNYSFFGFSGTFVLGKKSGDDIPVIKLNEDGCRITYDEANRLFTIDTPTGYKGTFDIPERSTSASGTAASNPAAWKLENNYSDPLQLKNQGMLRPTTSWYLSKIEGPRKRILLFEYDMVLNADNQEYESNYASITQPTWTAGSNFGAFMTIQEHVYLKTIEIPDEIRITFQMEDREDLERNYLYQNTDEFPLAAARLRRYSGISVEGLSGSSLSKDIHFHQSYFNYDYLDHGTQDKVAWLRSRLDKVTMEDQVYRFTYYYGEDGVPRKSTRGLDNFGHYNRKATLTEGMGQNVGTNNVAVSDPSWIYFQQSDFVANIDYGIAGALRRVYYPTGGFTEFNYDSHEYYAAGLEEGDGAEAVNANGDAGSAYAGGLRIRSIETDDGDGNRLRKSYEYLNEAGDRSSGLLMKPLHYSIFWIGGENQVIEKVVPADRFFAVNSAEGRNVGYSRVVERTENLSTLESFSSVYRYRNIPSRLTRDLDLTDFEDNWSNAYENGKIEYSGNREAKGDLVRTETTEYYPYQTASKPRAWNYGNISSNGLEDFWYVPYKIATTTLAPEKVTEWVHTSTGTITTESTYGYNQRLQMGTIVTTDSEGNSKRVILRRPLDFAPPSPIIQQLRSMNLIDPVLETITEVDGKIVGASGVQYEFEHDIPVVRTTYTHEIDKPFLASVDGSSFLGGYTENTTFLDYDAEGHPLEYRARDGVTTSFIWDDTHDIPLVQGQGVSFDDLNVAYAAAQGADYEEAIRQDPRTSSAMISTYDHDPLVGVVKTTGPNGLSTSFDFDEYERLRRIRDPDDNVLKEHEYNFIDYSRSTIATSTSLNFGIVNPGTSATEEIEITNAGNEPLLITDMTLPTHVSSTWDNQFIPDILVAPGEKFHLPFTFDAVVPGANSGTIVLHTPLGDQTVSYSAQVDEATRVMGLPETCIRVAENFASFPVAVTNDGNSLLTVTFVESDDEKVVPLHVDMEYDDLGFPHYTFVEVLPGSTNWVQVQLQSTQGDWDGEAELTFQSDATEVGETRVRIIGSNNPNGCE